MEQQPSKTWWPSAILKEHDNEIEPVFLIDDLLKRNFYVSRSINEGKKYNKSKVFYLLIFKNSTNYILVQNHLTGIDVTRPNLLWYPPWKDVFKIRDRRGRSMPTAMKSKSDFILFTKNTDGVVHSFLYVMQLISNHFQTLVSIVLHHRK